ncbi:MAG: hypothetical protein NT126_06910 [Bacteroidetes bacterium]|nr:hypothetical protein [Bacteroidota bacterium]
MKLAVEKKAELRKLSLYFEKIEDIASKMGVEVDDLIQEFKNNNTAAYANFKKSILAIAQKRQDVFKRSHKGNSPEEASVVGLSIIVNENYIA